MKLSELKEEIEKYIIAYGDHELYDSYSLEPCTLEEGRVEMYASSVIDEAGASVFEWGDDE